MQSYHERRPAQALASAVSSVWIQRVPAADPPYVHRSVPNGSIELLCRVGSPPRVVGPLTRPRVETLAPGTTVLGMRFRPGTASPILGLPASQLVDLSVEVEELWGRSAVALGDLVAESPSPDVALTALQARIAGRLADATGRNALVSEAVRQLGPWRANDVRSLRSSLHVSERQLRRRFQSAVGLAPKPLHRMLRFQGFLALTQLALSQGRTPAADGLARLAADAGYADQSHLTRECLRLTGMTPRAFLGETEQSCGCGHDHSASFGPLLAARAS